jgi:hypothetical protein
MGERVQKMVVMLVSYFLTLLLSISAPTPPFFPSSMLFIWRIYRVFLWENHEIMERKPASGESKNGDSVTPGDAKQSQDKRRSVEERRELDSS